MSDTFTKSIGRLLLVLFFILAGSSGYAQYTKSTLQTGYGFTGVTSDLNGNVYAIRYNTTSNKFDVVKYFGGTSSEQVIYAGLEPGGSTGPYGICVDGIGNVFVTNIDESINWDVIKLAYPSYTPTHILEGNFVSGLTSNADNDLITLEYDGDSNNYVVKKYPSTNLTDGAGVTIYNGFPLPTALSTRFPSSMAVDSRGNIYVTDFTETTTKGRIVKLRAPFYATDTVVATGRQSIAVSVDPFDRLYAIETRNPATAPTVASIVRYADSSFASSTVIYNSLHNGDPDVSYPGGLAVLNNGQIFAADGTDPEIVKLTPTTTQIMTFKGLNANPTAANTINFEVAYSGSVSGVNAGSFSITTSGAITGVSIAAVTPQADPTKYIITVNTGSGSGTIKLTANAGSINPPVTNAPKESDTYIIDKDAPSATMLINGGAAYTNNANLTLTLTASDANSGIRNMQFRIDNGTFTAVEPFATTKVLAIPAVEGSHTVDFRVFDNAGNATQVSQFITYDVTPPPTPVITAGPTDPTSSSNANFTFTGQTGATFQVSLDGAPYIPATTPYSLTGVADGTHTLSLKATDQAGNQSLAAASYTWTVDTQAPTVVSVTAPAAGYYREAMTMDFKVRFNEVVNVTNLAAGIPYMNIIVGLNTVQVPYTGGTGTNELTFTYTVAAGDNDMDGIAIQPDIRLNSGTIRDAVGNGYTGVQTIPLAGIPSTATVRVNTTTPTVSLTSTAPAVTNAPFNVTVTFSESVTGVTPGDFSVTNGLVNSLTQISGSTYIVQVAPSIDGTVSIELPAGAAFNIGSNPNSASNMVSRTADLTSPVVTAVSVPVDGYYKAGQNLDITVDFSETVAVSTAGGSPYVALNIGGTVVSANYIGKSAPNTLQFRYTIVSGNNDADGIQVTGMSLNGGTIQDQATNNATIILNNIASTANVRVNTNTPAVTLSAPAGPVNGDFTVTAVFSEAVSGLTESDFALTNGTASDLQTTDNITYTVTISPNTNGATTVNLPAAAAENIGTNPSLASNTVSVTADFTAPVVTSVGLPTNGYYVEGNVLSFTVNFSEVVNVNTAGGTPYIAVNMTSGVKPATYSGGTGTTSLTFSYTVVAGDEDMDGIQLGGGISLGGGGTIQDAATNNAILVLNSVGNGAGVKVNTTHPTVNITPVTPSPNNAPFTVTVTFSEAVTGLTVTDFNISSTTVSNLQTTDNITYTVQLAPSMDGNFSLSLPANTTANIAGNGNQASNTYNFTYDATAPVVSAVAVPANGYYKAGQALNFTVRFDSDININTTGGNPTLNLTIGSTNVAATYTGTDGTDGMNFSYTVIAGEQDMDGITVGTLALNGATIRDAATNNANLTLNSVGNTSLVRVNTTHPTVSLSAAAVSPLNAPFSMTVTFSEAVTGLNASDFTVTNATLGAPATSDNITYTVLVTPGTDGAVSVSLPADAAVNIGDNGNQASNTLSRTYDITKPTIFAVGVPTDAYYKAGDVLNFTVGFSENITVTGTPQLSLTIGAAVVNAAYTGANGTNGMNFAYTVVDGDQDMDGIQVTALTLNGGTIKDAATNDADLTLNNVANTTNVRVNTTKATVVLTAAPTVVNAPFTVTATFSEAVTGLTAGDFTVTNGAASALQTTDNITYTVTITPTADGAVTIQLPAAAAINIGANATQASNTLSVDYDVTAPTVTAVAVPANGNYKSGETLDFIVRFSEDINVNTTGGSPRLTLIVGTATVNATYTGTNGTNGLNFTYTVQNGDLDQDGIAVNTLTLNGATIRDAATNNADLTLNNVGNTSLVKVDGIVPTVTSVTVPANGYYKAGDALNFSVKFSENITLNTTGGNPTLALTIGSATVNATYTGLAGTDGLNFSYPVVTGDQDMDGITVGTLTLNGATIQDVTTNNADLTLNNVGNTANVRVNTTTATVVLTAPATLVNAPFTVTATFSEAVTGLTAGDFTVTNGAAASLQTTDNITYTVVVTPLADGVVTVQLPAAAAVNIGNNPTQVSNTLTVTYDATAPVVASVAVPAAAYYKAGDVLNFTVRFSENINVNTTAGNPTLGVIIGSTTVQASYTGANGSDGLNFSYTVVNGDMDMDGIQVGTLALNSAVIRDLAGNNANTTLNNVNPTNNVFVNTTHPTVTLSTAAASPTNAPFTATITFSEAVSGFATGDVTATNATLSGLQTTDNITFTVLVTPAADGAVSLTVPADIATNIGNNGNQASNTLSLTYDATAPVVTSVTVPANGYYKAGDVLNFTVNFNENLTINTTGGTPQLSLTIGTSTVTAANTTNGSNSLSFSYTVVDGDLDMDGITVGALTLNGATIKDAATNNANLALNSIAPTNNVFVNTVHPTVTVSTTAPALINAPFTATIIFSEAVTGFTAADVNATNAAVSTLQTTDNITYTVLVTPVADGTVAVSVPADVAVNIGNNGNQASNTISLTYDATAPVVTSVTVPADGYYKAGDVLNFTVKFSENITLNTTGGNPYLTIAIGATNVNAAYTGLAGTDGLNFSYAVVDGDQDMDGIQLGLLAINGATIRDAVGNNADLSLHNVGNTSNVKVNTTHATVVLTSAATLVNAPFTATVTFSEAVTGLTAGDFTATNAAVSNLQTTDNITYTVTVTPAADGAVTVQLPAAAAVNIGNNATQASNTLSVTYDATAPVVTSVTVPANGYYKAGQTLEFTVNFNEAINLSTTGGTPAINITIGTTTVQAAFNRVAGANGLVFSYTVQPGQMDLDGITVGTLTLNGGTIKDAATNNANLVLNSVGNTTGVFVHTASPSVQLSTSAPARTNAPFTVTIVFNEAVSGLAAGDFNITNGTAGTLSTTDNITYTLQVTPAADGTVTIQLPANQAVNVVSNGNTASNTLTLTYDATAPVITAGQSFDVIERSAVGTLVGKVIATEAAGTLQTWTIVTDNSNGAFSIDANGNVLVLDQAKLNAKVNTTVTLTVTVSDGLNTSVAVPVTINVKEKNLAPTLDPIGNTTICPEGSVHTIQLTGASATEPSQTYSFAIITDKPGNFDQLSVSAAGVVTYQLKTSASGTAKVTVTIKDNGGVANGGVDTLQRSFNITVATLGQVTITSDKGATISKGDIVHLTATGGTIFKWDDADGIISGQRSAVLEVRPMENTTYHVTVSNAAGCSNTADFTVNVIADFKVDATNMLTPNGDGKNDKWVIRNLDSYPDNEVKIFDRTGRLLYTRRNYSNDWDGTYNGSPLAEGTYYYILTIEGGAKTAKGYITIIRDRR